jgi:hypothetical protein
MNKVLFLRCRRYILKGLTFHSQAGGTSTLDLVSVTHFSTSRISLQLLMSQESHTFISYFLFPQLSSEGRGI